jgi:hypothetical protein
MGFYAKSDAKGRLIVGGEQKSRHIFRLRKSKNLTHSWVDSTEFVS